MTFSTVGNMPIEDLELTHYGVKGMKWGVRKGPSGREIQSARRTMLDARQKEFENAQGFRKKASIALLGETSKHLSKEYKAMPERAVGMRVTKGEMAAAALLAGPTGGTSLVVVLSQAGMARVIAKEQRKAAGG